jgi:hypothetical protein
MALNNATVTALGKKLNGLLEQIDMTNGFCAINPDDTHVEEARKYVSHLLRKIEMLNSANTRFMSSDQGDQAKKTLSNYCREITDWINMNLPELDKLIGLI